MDFWFFNNLSAISSFEFNETYYFRHILIYFSPFSCSTGPIIIIIIITGLIACSLVCLSLKLSRKKKKKKRTSSWGQSTVLFHDVICYCVLFEWISNFSDEIIVFFFSFLFSSLRVYTSCVLYTTWLLLQKYVNKPQKQLLSNAVCWGRCYSCCCCFFSRSFLSSVYRKQWQLSHRGDAKHNRGAKETRAWFCAAGLCYICKVRDEAGCKNRKCTFLSFLIPIHPSLSIIRREANGTRFLMGKGGKQNQKKHQTYFSFVHFFSSFLFFIQTQLSIQAERSLCDKRAADTRKTEKSKTPTNKQQANISKPKRKEKRKNEIMITHGWSLNTLVMDYSTSNQYSRHML